MSEREESDRRRGEVPSGNECKCIEIQIIILSRRIVCSIARSKEGGITACGGGLTGGR